MNLLHRTRKSSNIPYFSGSYVNKTVFEDLVKSWATYLGARQFGMDRMAPCSEAFRRYGLGRFGGGIQRRRRTQTATSSKGPEAGWEVPNHGALSFTATPILARILNVKGDGESDYQTFSLRDLP